MLVALALVGTIMAMVYGSYAAASRCVDRYGRRLASCERASLVLRLMARQIRCACAPAAPSDSTRSMPQTAAPGIFHADGRDAGGTILSFVTTGGPDRSTAFSRVQYRFDPSSGTLSIGHQPYVYRAEARPSSGYEQPLPGSQSGVTILRGVRRVDLQFYDGRQWRPTWEGAENAGLPRAVKIVLTLIDDQSRPHEYGTMAPVVSRKAIRVPPSPVGVAQL